ncbi:MAG: hypothetical protein WC732_08485 [Candidatus Omnitrophota bacterium]
MIRTTVLPILMYVVVCGAWWPWSAGAPIDPPAQMYDPPQAAPAEVAIAVSEYFKKNRPDAQMIADECSLAAVAALPAQCARATRDDFLRYSYAMMQCYYESTGRKLRDCGWDVPVKECTGRMRDADFGVFTQICTVAEAACMRLQGDVLVSASIGALRGTVEATNAISGAINELVARTDERTRRVGETLDALASVQSEQFRAVGDKVDTLTTKTVEHARLVSSSLDSIHTSTEAAAARAQQLADGQTALLEQHRQLAAANRAIADSVERMSWLQMIAFDRFADAITLVWYVGTGMIGLFLSASPRTARARLPLAVLCAALFVAERMLCDMLGAAGAVASLVIRACRYVHVFGAVSIMGWALAMPDPIDGRAESIVRALLQSAKV